MMDSTKCSDPRYILAALIEIYRGNGVFLPEIEPGLEKNLLMDVFSAAISFARFDESRQTLGDEIFKCSREGCTVREQAELAPVQTPDVLHAKMVAAAHVLKIMEGSRYKLS